MKRFSTIKSLLDTSSNLDLSEVKKIYLLGSTGAGKTSLVRNIIGTAKYAFPTTTQTRTTIAPTEYVIKQGLPLKTTIILKEKDDIIDSVEVLVDEAIQKALDNHKSSKRNLDDIILKLEESADERFRLKYMVPKDILEQKANDILEKILPHILNLSVDDETLLNSLEVQTEKQRIIKGLLEEIELTFKNLELEDYELFSNQPLYIQGLTNKNDFITRNKELLKNEFGSLTLLAEYIRIEGEQLLADWLQPLKMEFVLIDGEGIGHSLREKRETLSVRHYDFFDYCHQILLVEKGEDPFISGGQGAIQSVLLNGYKSKFKLIFAKIDKIEHTDKNAFLRRRLANLEDALERQNIAFDIENKETYKLEALHKGSTSDYSKKEIKRLLKDILNSKEPEFKSLEYDFNNFFSSLDTIKFISEYRQEIDSYHWMTIKAFVKRMYHKETEFNNIKPITRFLSFIMQDMNDFLRRDDQLHSDIASSQNKIKQELSKKLIAYIYKEFIVNKNHLWKQAFEEKGQGSHIRRKDFMFNHVVQDFFPYQDNIEKFRIFRREIKNLLLQSGAKELASAERISIKCIDIQKIYDKKNFKWILDDEVNILIGKNGTGKSTILKLINACINRDKELLERFGYPLVELTITKHYKGDERQDVQVTNSKNFADVKSILVDTFDAKLLKHDGEESELDCKLKKLIFEFGLYQRELNQLFEKESAPLTLQISEIMEDISQANPEELQQFQRMSVEKKTIKDKRYETINLFKNIIDGFLQDTNKSVVLDDNKEPLLIRLTDTKTLSPYEISSGEKQLLIIFLSIILQKDNPFILLMDEPETSLHVEWQSMLIKNIRKLNADIQIIIATHNPLMMLNRNSDEIGVIEVGNDIVKTEGRGAKYLDISSILLNYFGLSSLIGSDMQDDIKRFTELKLKEASLTNDNNELDEFNRLHKILENSFAGDIIYNTKYFTFLKYLKEHKDIEFEQYGEVDDQKMAGFLNDFGDFFND